MSENSIWVAGNTIVQRSLLRTNVICTACPLQHVRTMLLEPWYVWRNLKLWRGSLAVHNIYVWYGIVTFFPSPYLLPPSIHGFFLTSVGYFCFSRLRLLSQHFSFGDTQTSFTPWLWITLRPPLFLLSFFLCFCFPTSLYYPSFSRMVCSGRQDVQLCARNTVRLCRKGKAREERRDRVLT